MLPKATTVTEKYLEAIYKELRKMNGENTKKPNKEIPKVPKEERANEDRVELKGLERLECDICGKKFKTDASLKAHKTKVHK